MTQRISLNARQSNREASSAEIEVVLLEFSHPELGAPIRLSTDNTVRISDEPLIYGTRSNWRGADPDRDPYLWVIASAVLPDDAEDAPASAQIVLENLDAQMVEVLRSFTSPAHVALAVVEAATPDLIEVEYHDLLLSNAEGTSAEISLTLSREEIELEHCPAGRMTRQRFPGQWR